MEMNQEAIAKAIEETRFDKLKSQELKAGFKERNKKGNNFFRSGSAGNWTKELTETQIESIIAHHRV